MSFYYHFWTWKIQLNLTWIPIINKKFENKNYYSVVMDELKVIRLIMFYSSQLTTTTIWSTVDFDN